MHVAGEAHRARLDTVLRSCIVAGRVAERRSPSTHATRKTDLQSLACRVSSGVSP